MMSPPRHGGRLIQAKSDYPQIKHWLDLSTGLNPHPWQPPEIPLVQWHRLPEVNDGLEEAAQQYYGCNTLLPVAGTQAAIQALPLLRSQLWGKARVAILDCSYQEHAFRWALAGHEVVALPTFPTTESDWLDTIDVLVVINPNNPTTTQYSREQLRQWHACLAPRNGWLIVDEAFIDTQPEYSMVPEANSTEGLIVLRSVGKFFGLAGIRAGFVIATPAWLQSLAIWIGPWALNGPSRYLLRDALLDEAWQKGAKQYLSETSEKLFNVLIKYNFNNLKRTDFFIFFQTPHASHLAHQLRQHGILVREFETPSALRFGLPATPHAFTQLEQALVSVTRSSAL